METERPDARGEHNEIGYRNVDEEDSSSERGAQEPDVAEEIERPGDEGDRTG